MELMEARYLGLQRTLDGYQKSGTNLVSYDGSNFQPSALADDIGLHYFITKITALFGTSLDQSLSLFFSGMVAISFLLGTVGALLFFKSFTERLIAFAGLLLVSLFSFCIGDLYIVPSCIAIALIPLLFYLSATDMLARQFKIFLFLAGVGVGVANHLRVHSGTAIIIFFAIFLCFYLQLEWKAKFARLALFFAGFLVPLIFFSSMLDKRDAYLEKVNPAYKSVIAHNTFWHSIYIGFGYLENKFVPEYRDGVAFRKASSVSPGVEPYSQEYEAIMKREVFKLIWQHPYLTVQTVSAKAGVITFFLILFANFGLVAAYFYPKALALELAFWAGILFSALPAILVVPYHQYLFGLIAFAVLYGIFSINHAISIKFRGEASGK